MMTAMTRLQIAVHLAQHGIDEELALTIGHAAINTDNPLIFLASQRNTALNEAARYTAKAKALDATIDDLKNA